MTQEADRNTPERRKESVNPYPLESIFSASNPANVILFDASSSGYRRDHRLEMGDMINIYAPIFGHKGEIKDMTNKNVSMWESEVNHEYGEVDDSWRMESIREYEAQHMAEILFTPPVEYGQIQKRQQLLEQLSSSSQLDELIKIKNRAYSLIEGIGGLCAYAGPSFSEKPLINIYYSGKKTIPITDNGYSYGEVIGEEETLPMVAEEVDRITEGLSAIKNLEELIKLPFLKQTLIDQSFLNDVEKDLKLIVPFDKAEPKEDEHNGIWNDEPGYYLNRILRENIKPYLLRIGATLEFAKKIRDEKWGKISFDPNKQYGYAEGWNIERKKKGQVPNDSASDSPITILSGANTSGKSFNMKSDLLIRLAAQSLGFAPVKEGNLPKYDNFAYIDRASTDSNNDLSAFMRDLENWKITIPFLGQNTRLYVDEGYSTTSPQDQAKLLLNTALYANKKGGSVVLATHNDTILGIAENHPDMKIYHLETEVGRNGELMRHFKLKEGINESFALAVAKARNYPEDVLVEVENYLNYALVPTISFPLSYPKVESYSADEEKQMKTQLRSLESLFPNTSANSIFHLFSQDPDFHINAFLKNLTAKKDTFKFTIHDSAELNEALAKMILWNSGLSSSELLERQKTFRELIKKENYLNIHKAIENAGTLELTLSVILEAAKKGINKGLNPFDESEQPREDDKSKKELPTYFSQRDLSAAIAFLRIQQKLLGNSPIFMNLLNSLTLFSNAYEIKNKELKDESIDENIFDSKLLTNDEKVALDQSVKQLKTINKLLPAVPLKDINYENIMAEINILEEHREKRKSDEEKKRDLSGMFWHLARSIDLMLGGLPYAIRKISSDIEKTKELVVKLKAIDSIYLYQAANLLEQEVNNYKAILKGETIQKSGAAIREISLIDSLEIPKLNNLKSELSLMELKKTPFNEALKHLDALCLFAGVIQNEKLTPVSLNETGEIKLSNMFSIFKKKEDEIRNSFTFNPKTETVQLLTGPNGCGKTFHEKAVIASLLMGLATGYGPADRISIPELEIVIYLDRVVQKENSELSSFSQDLEYWKRLLPLLKKKKTVFAAVDEAFSTTSPVYQAAFTYAAISEFLKSGNYLMLATHNHDLVTKLQNIKTSLTNPYHFQFSIENGKINYKYALKEGHENSYATEVARTMGLPEEIIS